MKKNPKLKIKEKSLLAMICCCMALLSCGGGQKKNKSEEPGRDTVAVSQQAGPNTKQNLQVCWKGTIEIINSHGNIDLVPVIYK